MLTCEVGVLLTPQNYTERINTGPNCIHAHPPPSPTNTLLGMGGRIKRGGGGHIKFLPRGGSKYAPPTPSPEKCLLARNGGGGGVYNLSLE